MKEENHKIELSTEEIKHLNLINRVFKENEYGKELLRTWEKQYIGSSTLPPFNKHRDYPDYYGPWREGQNSFLRNILIQLKMYQSYIEGQKNV